MSVLVLFRFVSGVSWICFIYGPSFCLSIMMLFPNPCVCYLFLLVSFSPWTSSDKGQWERQRLPLPNKNARNVPREVNLRVSPRVVAGSRSRKPPSLPGGWCSSPSFPRPQVPSSRRDSLITFHNLLDAWLFRFSLTSFLQSVLVFYSVLETSLLSRFSGVVAEGLEHHRVSLNVPSICVYLLALSSNFPHWYFLVPFPEFG